ncbi:M48 family metalloprotease [Streptomyces sp. NBC_01363]|uniref:M48 family metalloprotease n=1 Tax=Streptomyces sp. NBC_01363 TaxID=2903840 RepID=UPI002258B474|nr:M48 family metalloprotease [Streptomyces sp. NBC_01363]MCX4730172.1 M48 family metalloprotease [Streptomyces sp. NBC_01363]
MNPPKPQPQNSGDGLVPPPDPYPTATAPPAPDDMIYEHGPGRRVYYTAHQRRVDITALGRLALALPAFLTSALVVLLSGAVLDGCLGLPFWIPAGLWLASGALVFHRPTEDLLARYLLGLRRPMPEETARLEPVWREVTAIAGVDGALYQLWIEESDDLNAYAAAGHIVGVTRFALEQLSSGRLAAVLAHELGHHTGGHAWSSLLVDWYGLPGRAAWRALRTMTRSVVTPARCAVYFTVGVLLLAIGGLASTAAAVLYGLPLLLVLPYLSAAVGRRAELRADRHAAALGFAPGLAEVLETMHANETRARQKVLPVTGERMERLSTPARLLSSHPDVPTRLHHLRHYL